MTDGEGADAREHLAVRFLRDVAADEDFFGSHARVADAVATVIETSDDPVVVGLIGAWGSGKSTVVKLLEDALHKRAQPTLFFTYDAWLHQSDPPRRAFLERFLDFLQRRSLASGDEWKEAMDVLNRRVEITETMTTPTLTAAGYLILFSLPLIPFGTRLISGDWYDKMFAHHWTEFGGWVFPLGLLLAAAPVLIALGSFYSWRPNRVPFTKGFLTCDNWKRHRPPHEEASLLAIIANKQIQKQKNRVVKTPDPTTIEFQSMFRDMLVAAASNGDRLVIVVDNLDRLPDNEAVAMWTTIRSFFLGAIPKVMAGASASIETASPAVRLPTVVLPIDDGAIQRIFNGQVDPSGKTAAESFMDKTFDMTFHVSRPVLSDWNAYLTKQLTYVFGDEIGQRWSSDVGRIFEKRSTAITPRDINRAVNATAALWLQWASFAIPFPTVAYYAIVRKSFETSLMLALNSPLLDLSENDPNWQQSLAAIHFGVPPESSLQILLDPKLRMAIEQIDHRAFGEQVKIKGFERILYSQLDANFQRESIRNLATLLDGAGVTDQDWAADVWRKLRRIFLRFDILSVEDDSTAETFDLLARYCDTPDRTQFLRSVAAGIGPVHTLLMKSAPTKIMLRDLLTRWVHWVGASSAEDLHVTIQDPSIYLDLADLPDVGRQKLIRTSASGAALASNWRQKLVDGQTGIDPLAQARLVLGFDPGDAALESLVDALHGLLMTNDVNFGPTEAGIHILGSLRAENDHAFRVLTEFGSTGALYQRTEQALNLGATTLAARLTALSILGGIGVPNPEGRGWAEYLNQSPGFASQLDTYIRAYGHKAYLHTLVDLVGLSDWARPLATAIMTLRLDSGKLGNLFVDRVTANIASYLDLLPLERHMAMVAIFADYKTFWQDLKKQDFSESAIRIFELLIEPAQPNGTKRKKARYELRYWLKQVGAMRWDEEIRNDGRLPVLARRLQDIEKRNLALGHAAFAALQTLYADLLASGDRAFMQRWFRAANLLTADGKRTILRGLRDQIYGGAAVSDLFGLVSEGGNLFVTTGDLGGKPDAAVRHVLLPMLGNVDALQWMINASPRAASWVAKADKATRGDVARHLKTDPGDGNQNARALREELLSQWQLGGFG